MRLWTIVLEISVLMAQFPSQRDRRALLRVPHARPRLRQYRRPADDLRHPYDFERRPRHLRRAHRHHDRHRLCDLGRDGGELGPFPGYERNRDAHAARHAQPPPRRLRRDGRLRAGLDRAGAARRRAPRPDTRRSSARAKAAWDQALDARREARLPQRAGDRDRADRHDRPRHGLRHHRHRARLRAGEVQEARRRRLFQDHQPRRAGGAAHARL